ncbi:MGH1-like glycoside hydrolase domain-containing protein [Arcticibacter eurypsychrophilus]|uniref:MGH1-like glycoside hydrolase domain-containing protein n=1 Tax=Arcticibacter eurypsychrophilus TaxID=1434752 RepID=UPI00084D7BB5|nr:glycosyl hydrolase family 65 protein [Arcticibacter eurypsychrophilus]
MKFKSICFGTMLVLLGQVAFAQSKVSVLGTDQLKAYTQHFNSLDSEDVKNYVPNDQAFEWLAKNVPLFECPDSAIQKIYYYRWWTLRKHLKETPAGFIFTEFITPVKHAGKFNAISSALGHHVYEGRWIHNPEYIKQYLDFWLIKEKTLSYQRFHSFSSWVDDAVYNFYLVNHDKGVVEHLLPSMTADYSVWENERQLKSGLFWQYDVKDAMEESVSGGRKVMNRRPSINSYMYGNAVALSKMAGLVKNDSLKNLYAAKASSLRKLVLDSLWNADEPFFRTKLAKDGSLAPREAIGFTPWYFNLPPDTKNYAKAWSQVVDTAGFNAPWGLTTAERREPTFRTRGSGHGCEWDGAVWPFATTQTLKGMSAFLNNYKNNKTVSAQVFYDELHKYALSHQMKGETYIGEYQDEKNGDWLKGDNPRSRFYNHSGFCDLVISDLVGLKPADDNILRIQPLVPQGQWDWFCLDNVLYHGKMITVLWDKTGEKYNRGRGFRVFADGKQIIYSAKLKSVKAKI